MKLKHEGPTIWTCDSHVLQGREEDAVGDSSSWYRPEMYCFHMKVTRSFFTVRRGLNVFWQCLSVICFFFFLFFSFFLRVRNMFGISISSGQIELVTFFFMLYRYVLYFLFIFKLNFCYFLKKIKLLLLLYIKKVNRVF